MNRRAFLGLTGAAAPLVFSPRFGSWFRQLWTPRWHEFTWTIGVGGNGLTVGGAITERRVFTSPTDLNGLWLPHDVGAQLIRSEPGHIIIQPEVEAYVGRHALSFFLGPVQA